MRTFLIIVFVIYSAGLLHHNHGFPIADIEVLPATTSLLNTESISTTTTSNVEYVSDVVHVGNVDLDATNLALQEAALYDNQISSLQEAALYNSDIEQMNYVAEQAVMENLMESGCLDDYSSSDGSSDSSGDSSVSGSYPVLHV